MQRETCITGTLLPRLKMGFGLVHAMQSNGPHYKFWRHTHARVVHPWAQVWVFWGTGVGSPGKPQGYLCQSLGGVHVMVLGLFEREVAYMIDHLH